MSDDTLKTAAADEAAAEFYPLPDKEELRSRCFDESIEALSFSGFVSDEEKQAIAKLYEKVDSDTGRELDVIECLVKVRHGPDAALHEMTEDLAYVASLYLSPSPILVPFSPSLQPPLPLYEKHPELKDLARALLAPIIYAEDTDVIGVCSLNSVAAEMAGEEASKFLSSRHHARPYVTVCRVDYRGWINLLNSHFNL